MKSQMLKIAGVKSEKEFYKKFPTEESFMQRHGEEFNQYKSGGSTFSGNAWYGDGGNFYAATPQFIQDTAFDMYRMYGGDSQYGGEQNYEYGGININPANRGKFNATKERTGKSTEELTPSSNALTRKRAIFAQNAANWHHQYGGNIFQEGGEPQIGDYPDYNSWQAAVQQYQPQESQMMEEAVPQNRYVVTSAPQQLPAQVAPIQAAQSRDLNNYTGHSVVDFLTAQGTPADYSYRKGLADAIGIKNYTGKDYENAQIIATIQANPNILNQYKSEAGIGSPRGVNKSSSNKRSVSKTPTALPKGTVPVIANTPQFTGANATSVQIPGAQFSNIPNQAQGYYSQIAGPNAPEYQEDQAVLNRMRNDQGTPANIHKQMRKDFAKDLAIGTLAPWLAEGALMAATTKYIPYGLKALPEVTSAARQASRALPYATRALPYAFAQGGPVVGQEMEVTPQQLEQLRQQGYQFEIL